MIRAFDEAHSAAKLNAQPETSRSATSEEAHASNDARVGVLLQSENNSSILKNRTPPPQGGGLGMKRNHIGTFDDQRHEMTNDATESNARPD